MARMRFENLAQAERIAQKRLPKPVWLAIKAGNEQGLTLRDNVGAFEELGFCPRVLDRPLKRSIDTTTTALGIDLSMPVMISPVGAQAIHPDGETGAARAAKRHGTAIGLSSVATDPLAAVLAANENVFFQLYWSDSRERVEERVRYAHEVGAKALIVTLDWSGTPRRDWCITPKIPKQMDFRTKLSYAPAAISRPLWLSRFIRSGKLPAIEAPNMWEQSPSNIPSFGHAFEKYENSAPPTREDIAWLRELWDRPILLKGVTTIADARAAVDLGLDAISVSNHGGNNIDGTPSSLRILPSIVDEVGDQIEILLDGGVRRGSDVVKAVAIGARAVLIGRAFLYGLAVAGEEGVSEVLRILHDGIVETLYGIGHADLSSLSRHDLVGLNERFRVVPPC